MGSVGCEERRERRDEQDEGDDHGCLSEDGGESDRVHSLVSLDDAEHHGEEGEDGSEGVHDERRSEVTDDVGVGSVGSPGESTHVCNTPFSKKSRRREGRRTDEESDLGLGASPGTVHSIDDVVRAGSP